MGAPDKHFKSHSNISILMTVCIKLLSVSLPGIPSLVLIVLADQGDSPGEVGVDTEEDEHQEGEEAEAAGGDGDGVPGGEEDLRRPGAEIQEVEDHVDGQEDDEGEADHHKVVVVQDVVVVAELCHRHVNNVCGSYCSGRSLSFG